LKLQTQNFGLVETHICRQPYLTHGKKLKWKFNRISQSW